MKNFLKALTIATAITASACSSQPNQTIKPEDLTGTNSCPPTPYIVPVSVLPSDTVPSGASDVSFSFEGGFAQINAVSLFLTSRTTRETADILLEKEGDCTNLVLQWFVHLYQRGTRFTLESDEHLLTFIDGLAFLALSPEEQSTILGGQLPFTPYVFDGTAVIDQQDFDQDGLIPGTTTYNFFYAVLPRIHALSQMGNLAYKVDFTDMMNALGVGVEG